MSDFKFTPEEVAKVENIIATAQAFFKPYRAGMPPFAVEDLQKENEATRTKAILDIEAVINEGTEQDD